MASQGIPAGVGDECPPRSMGPAPDTTELARELRGKDHAAWNELSGRYRHRAPVYSHRADYVREL